MDQEFGNQLITLGLWCLAAAALVFGVALIVLVVDRRYWAEAPTTRVSDLVDRD